MDSRSLFSELPRLRRYARALVGERAAADDLVQDTLERAWLFSIMHNLRVDQLRRPGLTLQPGDGELPEMPVRATQSDHLELGDLAAALERLPEEQRAVLLLVALEEMTYEEVASTLGIPLGTVMSRLARGRERLRQILAGQATVQLRVVR